MKKVLLAFAILAVLTACDKTKQPNGGNKTPDNPSTEVTQEVKKEALVKYFELNSSLTVYQALEKIKSATEEKTIDGLKVKVNSVTEESRNEQTGVLTVKIKGTVDGKAFEKSVSFDGFSKKPTDEAMAKRVTAKWKADADYLKDFDFDALRLKETAKFNAEYMAKFVTLMSSNYEGSIHYEFTPEDWAKTVISDIKYTAKNNHDGDIKFTVTYNNIKGNTGTGINAGPSLSFDQATYYRNQVSLNAETIKSLYMQGVYENIDVFCANLLNYDHSKFIPRVLHKINDGSDNSISLNIKLITNDGKETELAKFNIIITGFKSLSDLNKEMVLANSDVLGKHFGKTLRTSADGDKLEQVKKMAVSTWIEKAQMSIRRNGKIIDLTATKVNKPNGHSIVTVWKASGHGDELDLYFESPKFEVIEAVKDGHWLRMKLQLLSVNETSVNGVVISLPVHLLAD